ncbi:nucleoside diphosphate kinase regulator [Marinobacterium sediminicola]|uniref:Regulator of nucleoside diphosphate kinase n=1 Tax=Marinobacterium sediminicola TaxID=518898 RepID=A0ABY1RXN7_9GAMM|nr:nucleoside diphosphate kinase regulator [Marinobacterium sediminicola]ULG67729.1 nucleoside diphosphate kinase regulator [Marinobacterium sediminicola]SMR71628.1 regulator of nucleoside diphosphate kinase [Marinobacterium sediminicola]
MADMPGIKVSEKDIDQLEAMLERKEYRDNPALDGLRAELDRAEVVSADELPDNVVRMNSTVTFEVEESGRQFHRTLYYPHQMAGKEDAISIVAPIGSALLGLEVGQKIDWRLPDGKHSHVKIIEVSHA